MVQKKNIRTTVTPLQETKRAEYPFQHICIHPDGYYRLSESGNHYCFTASNQYSDWIRRFAIQDSLHQQQVYWPKKRESSAKTAPSFAILISLGLQN